MLWKLENIFLDGEDSHRLNNVSLEINSGITAVMGHSGAGKTSLLNLLVDFEKPDNGRITPSIEQGDHPLPLFWVPSNHGLWPHLNVEEHINAVHSMQPLRSSSGVSVPTIPEPFSCDELLAKFAISDKKKTYPAQLSCGECSRLSMARALAANPAILIMDEPLLNVDPARKLYFWDIIVDYAMKMNIAMVYVSHAPRYVIGSADNIICMQNGSIEYSGSVEELYHRPPSRELAEFLGEINWFTDKDSVFLPSGSQATALRPEQISIKKVTQGKLEVIRTRFMGEIAETELKDIKSGKSRIFFHRPAENNLSAGDLVKMELIRL